MTHQPGSALAPGAADLDAARQLLRARHHVDEADDALRLALDVPWDSPAATELREALAGLRALLADDRVALDDVRRLAAGRP